MKSMPSQKPGKSRQDYRTPPELLRAIERDFHVSGWSVDLAADSDNSVGEKFCGTAGCGSLSVDWSEFQSGDLWLNPPFANITPWAAKCANTIRRGRIFLLVPASVGSNWYVQNVDGKAHVVALRPRVTFVGEKDGYIKDLILAIYGPVRGGFSTWRWKS